MVSPVLKTSQEIAYFICLECIIKVLFRHSSSLFQAYFKPSSSLLQAFFKPSTSLLQALFKSSSSHLMLSSSLLQTIFKQFTSSSFPTCKFQAILLYKFTSVFVYVHVFISINQIYMNPLYVNTQKFMINITIDMVT